MKQVWGRLKKLGLIVGFSLLELCWGHSVQATSQTTFVGQLTTAGFNPFEAVILGETAYVTAYPQNSLLTINLQQPANPQVVYNDGNFHPTSIAFGNGLLYVTNFAPGPYSIIVFDPANITAGPFQTIVTPAGDPNTTELNGPHGIAVDSSGNLHVLNRSSAPWNIQTYSTDGLQPGLNTVTPLSFFNNASINIGVSGFLIDVDSFGNIYLPAFPGAPPGIYVFPPNSAGVNAPYSRIIGVGTLVIPSGVSIDAGGNIHVTDLGAGGFGANTGFAAIFDPQGNLLLKYAVNELSGPLGVTVVGNYIYIADHNNQRVPIYHWTVNLQQVVNSGIQGQVAQYLDFLQTQQTMLGNAASPDFGNVLVNLFSLSRNPGALQNALNQLQPSPNVDLNWLGGTNQQAILTVVRQELRNRQIYSSMSDAAQQLAFAEVPFNQLGKFQQLVANTPLSFQETKLHLDRSRKQSRVSRYISAVPNTSIFPHEMRITGKDSSAWVQHIYQNYHQDNTSTAVGINADSNGFAGGYDYRLCPDLILGALLAYGQSDFKWKNNVGRGDLHTTYGGLYGTWGCAQGPYVDAAILGGYTKNKSHRNINFAMISRTANQSHHAKEFSGAVEVGYDQIICSYDLQPFVNGTYLWMRDNQYTEHDAGSINLHVNARKTKFVRVEAGGAVSQNYCVCDIMLRPTLKLSYVRSQIVDGNGRVQSNFVGQLGSLIVTGDRHKRNMVSPAAALTALFDTGAYVTATYVGEFNHRIKNNIGLLQLGYQF